MRTRHIECDDTAPMQTRLDTHRITPPQAAEASTDVGAEQPQPGRRAPLPGSDAQIVRVIVGAFVVLACSLLLAHFAARVF